MTVIKLTKSGKAVQVIDDEGNVFGTSKIYLQNLINGTVKGNFVLLAKYPFKVNPDRFQKSELWTPPGYIPPKDDTKNTSDALSVNNRKDNETKKSYMDVKVW